MEQFVVYPDEKVLTPDGRVVTNLERPVIDPEDVAFLEAYNEASRRKFEKETGLKADRPNKRKGKKADDKSNGKHN